MAGKGGYQAPAHPAPASGPGALSHRTDGGPGQPMRVPTGMPYGDASAMAAQEQAAPMAQTTMPSPSSAAEGGLTAPPPLTAGTRYPDQPVTAGAASGPGPGMEVLSPIPSPLSGAQQSLSNVLAPYAGQNAAVNSLLASLSSRV